MVADPDTAKAYGVRRSPTFIYIRNGEEVRRHAGFLSESGIKWMFRDPLF